MPATSDRKAQVAVEKKRRGKGGVSKKSQWRKSAVGEEVERLLEDARLRERTQPDDEPVFVLDTSRVAGEAGKRGPAALAKKKTKATATTRKAKKDATDVEVEAEAEALPQRKRRRPEPKQSFHDRYLSEPQSRVKPFVKEQPKSEKNRERYTKKQLEEAARRRENKGDAEETPRDPEAAKPAGGATVDYDVWTADTREVLERVDAVRDSDIAEAVAMRKKCQHLNGDDETLVTEFAEPLHTRTGYQKPSSVARKRSRIAAVEVAPSGASYNPSYEAHQATLRAAVEEEERRQRKKTVSTHFTDMLKGPNTLDMVAREAEQRNELMSFAQDHSLAFATRSMNDTSVDPDSVGNSMRAKSTEKRLTSSEKREKLQLRLETAAAQAAESTTRALGKTPFGSVGGAVREEEEGSGSNSDDDDDEDDDEEEGGAGAIDGAKKKGDGERKTRAQREKARKAGREMSRAKAKKRKTLRLQEVFKATRLVRDLKNKGEVVDERAARRLRRSVERERMGTVRLGKHEFVDEEVPVKLTEDLRPSFRELVPEGNLLVSRLKSLQKRNLIEPRAKAKAPKPWKTKTYVYKHIKEYVRQEGMEEKRVAKEEAKRLKNAAAL